jgi:predicted nuclease of predicted toxin-antitoxin system
MLLLDQNLPHQLRELLADYGFEAETANFRGWAELRNGELTRAAYQAGFRTILTRDVLFGQSASKALEQFPDLAVVVIRLPQRAWKVYREAFVRAWMCAPLVPSPGKVITWPESFPAGY